MENGTIMIGFRPTNYGMDPSLENYAYTTSYKFNKSTGKIQHTRLNLTDSKEVGKKVTRKLEF